MVRWAVRMGSWVVAAGLLACCATDGGAPVNPGGEPGGKAASKEEVQAMSQSRPKPLRTPPKELLLAPMPKSLERYKGVCSFGAWGFDPTPEDALLLKTIDGALSSVAMYYGHMPAHPEYMEMAEVAAYADPEAVAEPQGYVLTIEPGRIELVGHNAAGLFYAAQTLGQIAWHYRGTWTLPCLTITDAPDFPNRGFMLDISRDKVPEMETLYQFADWMASVKLNQLQLYTEHTFAYPGHHVVWEEAAPMTAWQIEALDAYCRARHIELVPNQNSFGHMARWLNHEGYQHLAETDSGWDLCAVDPASVEFLRGLYADLLPSFSSTQFNVGCDETWTLGEGRSKEECERLGEGRVYLNFLLEIHKLCQAHGKRMQFWGDIINRHPELIPELPEGIVALEWGYEADHPFDRNGKRFADSGVPFYVCPGTSSWNSLIGRTQNALGNLHNAAENGLKHGAEGYLITDWGDNGHWQFFPVSWLPALYGASVSWGVDANADLDAAAAANHFVFRDEAEVIGQAAYDLGVAHRKSGVLTANRNLFANLLLYDRERPFKDCALQHGSRQSFEATLAAIEAARGELHKARLHGPDADLVLKEFDLGARMCAFACELALAREAAGGVPTSELPADARKPLAETLRRILPEYRQLWLARNRSGGLKDSAGRLKELLVLLEEKEQEE